MDKYSVLTKVNAIFDQFLSNTVDVLGMVVLITMAHLCFGPWSLFQVKKFCQNDSPKI